MLSFPLLNSKIVITLDLLISLFCFLIKFAISNIYSVFQCRVDCTQSRRVFIRLFTLVLSLVLSLERFQNVVHRDWRQHLTTEVKLYADLLLFIFILLYRTMVRGCRTGLSWHFRNAAYGIRWSYCLLLKNCCFGR